CGSTSRRARRCASSRGRRAGAPWSRSPASGRATDSARTWWASFDLGHMEGAMGAFSLFHLVITLALLLVVSGIPAVMILRKAGYSGWWCLLGFVPIVNIVMLWVFAFSEWPNLRDRRG